jgi:pimeloyl-ACP methyl ester carboxylesterase
MAQLIQIAAPPGQPLASALFVHGLGGNLQSTWRCREDEDAFWPRWLARDCNGLAVYVVGYDAPISRWRGSAMHFTDQATNVLVTVLAESKLRRGPLIFIGHSLGGLLIKQIMRTADSMAHNDTRAADFIGRVEKVAFLATPHFGAGLATLGDRLRILVRPSMATASLVRNDPNLRDLNNWYRNWANARPIGHLVLTETIPTSILGMIVPADAADPGLANVQVVAIPANHSNICKPESDKSDTYVLVRDFITRPLQPPTQSSETKKDQESLREPLMVTFAGGIRARIEFKGVIQAIADQAPLLVANFGTYQNAQKQIMDFLESKIRNEFAKHTLAEAQSSREAIIANVITAARPELEKRFMHRIHDIILVEIRQSN